jgi:hypothetical protein
VKEVRLRVVLEASLLSGCTALYDSLITTLVNPWPLLCVYCSPYRHLRAFPLASQVRLLEDEPSYCTYGDAYEINCARYGREPDVPIQEFKRMISDEATGQYRPDPDGALRLAAYTRITERSVQDSVFSQYIYKTMHNANHLQMFKKVLCCQFALSGEGGWGPGWSEARPEQLTPVDITQHTSSGRQVCHLVHRHILASTPGRMFWRLRRAQTSSSC